jgi:hypothetical protein
MGDSARLQEFKNLLLLYNLVNTTTYPPGIAKKLLVLIDVFVING